VVDTGERLVVRVVVRAQGDVLVVDLSESSAAREGWGVGEGEARGACIAAVASALEQPVASLAPDAVEVIVAPGTCVAQTPGGSPHAGRRALLRTRISDAVLGALQQAWPGRVGAGSCVLGAVVELVSAEHAFVETVPGGEGARPGRPGAAARVADFGDLALRGPPTPPPPWLRIREEPREASGGVGARNGGDGVVRRYEPLQPCSVRVCFDRVDNPPHGIDRAGPPQPTRVSVLGADGRLAPVASDVALALDVGDVLHIETSGGAGHGFPGWGFDYEPERHEVPSGQPPRRCGGHPTATPTARRAAK
jgi:N-methylhydantoinase B